MPRELSFRSAAEGLASFREQLLLSPMPADASVTALPLDEIVICEGVFQQRDTSANAYQSEGHIRVLAGALSDTESFDPVTVWWSGHGWTLIDGHHRVRAYQRRGHTGNIPVVVFPGSPGDALAASAGLNSRNKLMMTQDEKANAAVRLCLLTEKSRSEIVKASGSSDGRVAEIRRTIRQLRERGLSDEVMLSKSWKELRETLKGEREMTQDYDQYTQRKADEIKRALFPIFGKNPVPLADALALALDQLPHELTRRTMSSQYFPVPWGEPGEEPEEEPEDY